MRQFLSYYGSKKRAAPRYPAPRYPVIVEPFAGSAGYSTTHHTHKVLLRDTYKPIVDAWRFLIRASHDDIMDLPLLEPGESLASKGLDDGSRALIGFWTQNGRTSPHNKMSSWSRKDKCSFWGERKRKSLASQVHAIKHWECALGTYSGAPDIEATWHIDPPYVDKGTYYRESAKNIDFQFLGDWCKSRRGQVMVCEQAPAEWLPFVPMYTHKNISQEDRTELIWTND